MVLLFTDARAFDAYSRAHYGVPGARNLGVYRREDRTLAVDASGGADYLPTLTHEIVHPLIEAGFPAAPLWLDEGIASLYEAPTFDAKGGIRGVARNWRHDELRAALAGKPGSARERPRLDALFGMSTRAFKAIPEGAPLIGPGAVTSGDEATVRLHYALARSVCAWLDEEGWLWPLYRAWRDDAANDPTGVAAFTRVVGESPAAANDRWTRWAR